MKVQHINADSISLTWTCVVCKHTHNTSEIDLDIVGGCAGHEPGDYCHCPLPAEAVIATVCSNCRTKAVVALRT